MFDIKLQALKSYQSILQEVSGFKRKHCNNSYEKTRICINPFLQHPCRAQQWADVSFPENKITFSLTENWQLGKADCGFKVLYER